MKLSRTIRVVAVLAAAAIVLAAGLAYTATRAIDYESRAVTVLALGKVRPGSAPTLLTNFDRSGVSGTFVELLSAQETLRAAGSPPIAVDVRAVPDTRTIELVATGDEGQVQPGLASVIAAAQRAVPQLNDPFKLRVLDPPSPPQQAGPSTGLLVVATLLLAALAALFVAVVTRRVVPVGSPAEADAGRTGASAAPGRRFETTEVEEDDELRSALPRR